MNEQMSNITDSEEYKEQLKNLNFFKKMFEYSKSNKIGFKLKLKNIKTEALEEAELEYKNYLEIRSKEERNKYLYKIEKEKDDPIKRRLNELMPFSSGFEAHKNEYADIFNVINNELSRRRILPFLKKDFFEHERNNPPRLNQENHNKLLKSMLKVKVGAEIVRGDYESEDGWRFSYYIEYYRIPMEYWNNLFPLFSLGVTYSSRVGIVFMDQFFKVNLLLGEVLSLLNHTNNIDFKLVNESNESNLLELMRRLFKKYNIREADQLEFVHTRGNGIGVYRYDAEKDLSEHLFSEGGD